MDFGSAMSLRFYHVLVLQFRFLHGLFVRTGDETEVHIDARCILAGRRQVLQCMNFFWWLYYWITFWNGSVYSGVAT